MPMMVGGGGDSVSFMDPSSTGWGGGSPTQETASYSSPVPVDYSTQNITQQANQYAAPVYQDYSSPVYQPYYPPQPSNYMQAYQPRMNYAYQGGNNLGTGGGYSSYSYTPPPPPPPKIIHNAQEYINNGHAYTDPTYEAQKAALLGKLNDYERNVAGKVGSQNLSKVDVPQGDKNYGLLGSYFKGNSLGDLYKTTQDQNGNNNYKSTGALDGGTMGTDFNSAIANFQNQQQEGLRNLAEGYAARGMLGGEGLGGGSGVWQNARTNLENQYNNQIGNINNSVIAQYNDLLSNLADQYSQGNQSLTGYLGDASQRMATAANAGLPTG